MPRSLPPEPPASACPHAGACAGAALCRFAPPAEQVPHPVDLERGARLPLAPVTGRRCFHAVRSGLAAVTAAAPDGRRQILCLNGAGELVCPGAPGGPGHALEALGPTRLCRIDLAPHAARLARDPAFVEALFHEASEGLARISERLVTLGRRDGPSRVAAFLCEMAERLGHAEGGALRLALPMTREDMADYLGLNPETVSRLLGRVRKAGLVRFLSPTSMEILDARALADLADGGAWPAAAPA